MSTTTTQMKCETVVSRIPYSIHDERNDDSDEDKDSEYARCEDRSSRHKIQDGDVHLSAGGDAYVYDPYNSLNTQITPNDIKNILHTYGIDAPIFNFNLYKRAFVHRSYVRHPFAETTTESMERDTKNSRGFRGKIVLLSKPIDCIPLSTKSNERLEFVGDGILECITKYYLYRRFPKENEGFMTEKKIALVKNEAIGKIAYEMGLHKWLVLSKHVESKHTRTNLKKLGCLFEAFIGAMFLDFNKISVHDDEKWFSNLFVCGPGFQMVQIFIETVFEKHVNWVDLIRNDDNYKNILQVKIQKEFKVTPDYLEMAQYNTETGFHMGVYLCLGQHIHGINICKAIPIHQFSTTAHIHDYVAMNGKVLVLLGEGHHKIKRKAEQTACDMGNQMFPVT